MYGQLRRRELFRKLLVVADSLEGGLGQAARSEADYFEGRGWSVSLAAPESGLPAARATSALHLPVPIPGSVGDVRGMLKAVRALRSAGRGVVELGIVHAHGLRAFVVARVAFPNLPVAVTFHGAVPTGWGRRTVFGIIPWFSAAAISVGPVKVRGWEHLWHWSPLIVGEPLSPVQRPEPASPLENHLVIGWFGRLDHPKRPDIWIGILRAAANSGINVRGIVVGEGPLEAAMRLAALTQKLDVSFRGPRPPIEAFQEMDVLLTWSDSEGVPFVIQEGIWAGIPCLSNNLPGPRALLGATPSSIVSEEEATHALFLLRDAQARRDLHAQQLQHIRRLQTAGRPEMVLEARFSDEPPDM